MSSAHTFAEIFIIPAAYDKLKKDCEKRRSDIYKQIADMEMQAESLITRITLASDKTLQRMIDEVDDMGDISLMDTTIRQISAKNIKYLTSED